jgi:hypothetical protein
MCTNLVLNDKKIVKMCSNETQTKVDIENNLFSVF